MGNHLIAHASGSITELEELIPVLFPIGKMEEFKRGLQQDVIVWRRIKQE